MDEPDPPHGSRLVGRRARTAGRPGSVRRQARPGRPASSASSATSRSAATPAPGPRRSPGRSRCRGGRSTATCGRSSRRSRSRVWSEGGRWGRRGERTPAAAQAHPRRGDGRLPLGAPDGPLRDVHDPDLMGAFQKLGSGMPEAARRARREHPRRHGRGGRPTRRSAAGSSCSPRPGPSGGSSTLTYDTGAYAPGREPRAARVRPYLIEPSSHDPRALPHRLRRDPRRRCGRSRSSGSGSSPLTGDRFEPPDARRDRGDARRRLGHHRRPAPTEVVLRFAAAVAGRVAEARWHPTETREAQPDGRSSGGRRSPARSRSASGSCPGAPTWRSSHPRPAAVCASRRGAATVYGPSRRSAAPERSAMPLRSGMAGRVYLGAASDWTPSEVSVPWLAHHGPVTSPHAALSVSHPADVRAQARRRVPSAMSPAARSSG